MYNTFLSHHYYQRIALRGNSHIWGLSIYAIVTSWYSSHRLYHIWRDSTCARITSGCTPCMSESHWGLSQCAWVTGNTSGMFLRLLLIYSLVPLGSQKYSIHGASLTKPIIILENIWEDVHTWGSLDDKTEKCLYNQKKAAIIQIGLLVVIVSEILLTKWNRVSGENMMDEWMDRRTNPQISAS